MYKEYGNRTGRDEPNICGICSKIDEFFLDKDISQREAFINMFLSFFMYNSSETKKLRERLDNAEKELEYLRENLLP